MSKQSSRQVAKSASQQTGAAPLPSPRDKQRPETTPDGHYIVVKGRRWRATDPLIPQDALVELKHYLAKGRSGVRGKNGVRAEDDEGVQLSRKAHRASEAGPWRAQEAGVVE